MTIDITLSTIASIGNVAIQLAGGGAAEVQFPQQIIAYSSLDGKSYSFARQVSLDEKSTSNPVYEVQSINLDIKKTGKYLKLVIFPAGPYLSIGEVGVYSANSRGDERVQPAAGTVKLEADRVVSEARERFSKHIQDLYDKRDQGALDAVHMPISGRILQRRAAFFTQKGIKPTLIVENISPWLDIDPITYVPGQAPTEQSSALWLVPTGTCKSQGILITNNTSSKKIIAFQARLSGISGNFSVHNVGKVRDRTGRLIFDPIEDSKPSVQIDIGETKFLFAKFCGTEAGKGKLILELKYEGGQHVESRDLEVIGPFPQSAFDSVTWGYLTSPPWQSFMSSTSNLIDQGETTVVIPTELVAGYPHVDNAAAKKYVQAIGFRKGRLKKIILFIDMSRKGIGREQKAEFALWYKNWIDVLKSFGDQAPEVYVYPFDEPRQRNIAEAADFFAWLKENFAEAKIFVTINVKAAMSLQKYADIVCVHSDLLKDGADEVRNLTAKNYWIYFTNGPSKSNSVYEYYKLAAWKALSVGASGVGFWSATDTGTKDYSGDDAYKAGEINYSVLYASNGTIVSSRRWEAWVSGVNDVSAIYQQEKETKNIPIDFVNLTNEVLKDSSVYTADHAMQKAISNPAWGR